MPKPWENDPVVSSAKPWEADELADPIGIRAATPWESIKSRAQEFLHDPIGTLSRPIPGTEDYQGRGDAASQIALGGIAPGGATLREFAALPKSKGLAKVTEFPSKLAQAYRNATSASEASSAARVAQAGIAEGGGRPPAVRVEPSPKPPMDLSPIPGSLPSGRKPGGIANQTLFVPMPAAPQIAATDTKALDDIAMSLGGKKYAKLDANGQATVQKIAAKGSTPTAPVGLTAPKTPAPAATAPPPISKPLGGVSPADNETNLVNTLRGNTTRKNLEIGQYFTAKGMTPEQVAAMPEAQFNSHIRNVKNASGNPYQPSTGRNYHRTPEQARADVVNAMRAMQPLPAPTMPTMIPAPPAPRGYFPPPTWPPQPPAQ